METIWVHQLNRSSSDLPINNVDKIVLFVYWGPIDFLSVNIDGPN